MIKIFISIALITCFVSCDTPNEVQVKEELSNIDNDICDCYQSEHKAIGIDFYKEINAYKEYIAMVSLSKDNNFSKSLLSNYEEMDNRTFETRPADTVFQKSYLESIDVSIVKQCIAKHSADEEVAKLIQRLDQVGLSETYTSTEQLAILITFEKEINTSSKVTWIEPLELNAFFYMYDRYNKAAKEVKIEVFHEDELLQPPPPPMPTEVLPPIEDEKEEEETN